MHNTRRLLSPKDVEREFGLSRGLQAKWRMGAKFAPFVRVGKGVFYERADIERWLASNKRNGTRDRASTPLHSD